MFSSENVMLQKYNPLVSIVTPSLNQGRFIEQTILSVINQTYSTIEYIIVDGGSTDRTLGIIKDYENDARIKLIVGKDKGQYDAVNEGFMLAQGQILGWINADDMYTESTIEKIVGFFKKHPDADIVYGKFYHMDEDNAFLREMPAMPYSYKWLRRYCFINPSVTFIKSCLIHKEGILIDNDISDYGDWDWFLRIAESGKRFYFLPEFLGHFRMHQESKIARMSHAKIHKERVLISQRHHIPLNYLCLWADVVMPWIQRGNYCSYLLRKRKWYTIFSRIWTIAKRFCKNLSEKII